MHARKSPTEAVEVRDAHFQPLQMRVVFDLSQPATFDQLVQRVEQAHKRRLVLLRANNKCSACAARICPSYCNSEQLQASTYLYVESRDDSLLEELVQELAHVHAHVRLQLAIAVIANQLHTV